ncbi:sensor histidine kinase [Massilia sp. S19_KUP03_FR1]|uniref:sensor histidine kinase n=1 Tax=Massilia sp. S19_KUP03_FR1 TaxID=3025503 RepID=UPI002FCD93A6
MDLRRQLVAWLGAILLGLMMMTVTINLVSLRSDVGAEIRSSERLALALLGAGQVKVAASDDGAARLAAILERGALRHIAISVDGAAPVLSNSAGARLAGWLGLAPGAGHAVTIGGQVLRIAPNPASEIDERLADIVQLWSTLLFFSGATLVVAWWAADRALRPVRALETGLQRLADGEPDAALPRFALREFARVAAAIDHLAAALTSAQHGQRRLAHQLIRVQEDERRTLAMELHDEVGQTLTAISLTAAYLARHAAQLDGHKIDECAQDLRRDVRACSEQLRAMLSRLRPHSLEGPGLASALRDLLRNWQQRECGIAFAVTMPDELPPIGMDASLVLYRVVQEALTNVVRHSHAARCLVEFSVTGASVTVRIEDDGCGLASAATRGCGLTGMAERLRMVGGQLQVANGAGGGVHLAASLPIANLVGEVA